MTKTFCDKCGKPACDSFPCATEAIGERLDFQLRAVFEVVEEPAPCGSLGLSQKRTKTADICIECEIALMGKLIAKMKEGK